MGFSYEMSMTIPIVTGMTSTENVPKAFGSEFHSPHCEAGLTIKNQIEINR